LLSGSRSRKGKSKRAFDRIYRIDWIMIFPGQAGCLPGNSSASGGESFQPAFRDGWKTASLLPSHPGDPVNPVKYSCLLPACEDKKKSF